MQTKTKQNRNEKHKKIQSASIRKISCMMFGATDDHTSRPVFSRQPLIIIPDSRYVPPQYGAKIADICEQSLLYHSEQRFIPPLSHHNAKSKMPGLDGISFLSKQKQSTIENASINGIAMFGAKLVCKRRTSMHVPPSTRRLDEDKTKQNKAIQNETKHTKEKRITNSKHQNIT